MISVFGIYDSISVSPFGINSTVIGSVGCRRKCHLSYAGALTVQAFRSTLLDPALAAQINTHFVQLKESRIGCIAKNLGYSWIRDLRTR